MKGYLCREAVAAGVMAAAMFAPVARGQAAPDGSNAGQAAGKGQHGRRGEYGGMGRVMGEVTAVNGNTLTLKTGEGTTVEVVTTDNTRLMKDSSPVHIADFHPGDGLMALGNLDPATKALHAAVVFAEDAAQIKAMRANLGKTYITGRVKSVDLDDARLTVERGDHVTQTIGFDETTSFKRVQRAGGGSGGPGGSGSGGEGTGRGPGDGRFGGGMGMGGMALGEGFDRAFSTGESITLADIKAGDFLAGTGSVKGGVFVPTRVIDSLPGHHRQPGEGSPANAASGVTGSPEQP